MSGSTKRNISPSRPDSSPRIFRSSRLKNGCFGSSSGRRIQKRTPRRRGRRKNPPPGTQRTQQRKKGKGNDQKPNTYNGSNVSAGASFNSSFKCPNVRNRNQKAVRGLQ